MSSSLGQSVDALWAEMQSESNSRLHTADVTRLLNKSTISKTKLKTNTSKPKMTKQRTATAALSSPSFVSVAAQSDGLTNLAPPPHELFSLSKELNRLADERQSVRKQAALTLETHLLHCAPEQLPAILQDQQFRDFAKRLFKRFNDPVEKVREICIKLSTKFITQEHDLLRVLPYLMPAISNRIDSQWGYDEENQVFTRSQFFHDAFKRGRVVVKEDQVPLRVKRSEPSEEIRLLFLELLSVLLQNAFAHNASSILHAYVFDIVLILVSSVADDFHEVNIMACTLLKLLCDHMVSVMKHFTVAFVRASKHLLGHRLAKVRISAVTCIQSLVSCPNFEKCKGSGTEAIVDLIGHRDENVIPIAAFYTGEVRVNYFAKLDQDTNALVRQAFYRLVKDWILNLPDRYDHESRLMPYLLSAVSDELHETSCSAMETLEELGKRYEQEHGEDVLEMKQYGVDGKNPLYNYTKLLPAPFLGKRPSLGTRLYVRGRTRRFLNPILNELENWQSPTRAHAVRLLKCVLVYSEETITVDAHTLIQTILKTWWKQETPEMMGHFYEIADLMGRFIAPKTYLPLLLARIRGDHEVLGSLVTAETVTVALEVLACVMGGSLDKALLPHVQEIVEVLGGASVVQFETPRLKLAQGKVVLQLTQLLQRKGRDAVSAYFLENGRLTTLERMNDRLFELAVSLTKSAQHEDEATQVAKTALAVLQQIETKPSLGALYDVHFDACFPRATAALQSQSEVQWRPQQMDQVIVEQFLTHNSMAFFGGENDGPSCDRMTWITTHFQAMLRDSSSTDKDEEDGAIRKKEPYAACCSARAVQYQTLLLDFLKRMEPSTHSAVETLRALAASSEQRMAQSSQAIAA